MLRLRLNPLTQRIDKLNLRAGAVATAKGPIHHGGSQNDSELLRRMKGGWVCIRTDAKRSSRCCALWLIVAVVAVAVVGASVCIFIVPEMNPEAEQC